MLLLTLVVINLQGPAKFIGVYEVPKLYKACVGSKGEVSVNITFPKSKLQQDCCGVLKIISHNLFRFQ